MLVRPVLLIVLVRRIRSCGFYLLILLVRTYREHTNIISKVEEIVTNTISKALKEALNPHTNTISKDSNPTNVANNNPTTKPPKKEMMEPPGRVC
jgi:NADPH-dependent 7-cyano-7-deazaguanine reductase QueF